jgi:hypothetical protein
MTNATYDPSCTAVDGVIKVCNNDFGATGWYGINEALSSNKLIISSVAKMNDYYFTSNGNDMYDRRQYTMCHEMGHGECSVYWGSGLLFLVDLVTLLH